MNRKAPEVTAVLTAILLAAANGVSSSALAQTAERPDLWVEAIPPNATSPKARFHVWNTGKKASGPFSRLLPMQPVVRRKQIAHRLRSVSADVEIADVAAGAVAIRVFPDGLLDTKCHYSITVVVDVANKVAESNEGNNSDAMQW